LVSLNAFLIFNYVVSELKTKQGRTL